MPGARFNIRRAKQKTFVHVLFSHPMESGLRTDANGIVIPAWYLTDVTLQHNDVTVSTVTLTPQASKNPVLSFQLDGGKAGDVIKVSWMDNRSKSGERTATLAEQ